MELYKKYRPRLFKQIVGQQEAVQVLARMAKKKSIPHSLLFVGPSGCGKTTLARIVRKKVGAAEADTFEINCADFRGIDMVRDIRGQMQLAPMSGDARAWIIDEAHQLSNQAQNAFLKLLEDTPSHVYFMLATTDPQKLLKTVRTRCTQINLGLLAAGELEQLVRSVLGKEGEDLGEDAVDLLVEVADGSARKVLVLLEQVLQLTDAEAQLDLLQKRDSKQVAIQLARCLIKPRPSWKEIASILKELKEEPETLRWMVMGYCNSVLLGGGKLAPKAAMIIDEFADPFYNTKKAGLTLACWRVLNTN